jgi:hypothetical protein
MEDLSMKRVTLTVTACLLAVLALLPMSARAQDTNTQKRTFMTFSNTVEMPGVTLPAGTYLFRLADTQSRNVVQVLSQDEKQVLGQWLFVQAERPQASSDTVVMFKEAPENSTPAVQYWYYPGERIGREFVYPKDQATKIAARTSSSVLTEEGRITPEEAQAEANGAKSASAAPASTPATAASNADNSSAADSSAADSSQVARNSVPAPDQSAQAVGTTGAVAPQSSDRDTAAAAVPESQTARAELPRTASTLPLSGLIGLLALAGALGARSLASARS